MFAALLVTTLPVGLSHQCEHKFRHSFWDSLDPMCNCCKDAKTIKHFLLHRQHFTHERHTPLESITDIDSSLLFLNEKYLTQTLLYGDKRFTDISDT